jgi:hypothetical protein
MPKSCPIRRARRPRCTRRSTARAVRLVLQSVLLSPERKAAVISGKVVAPGGRIEGLTLVRLTETEATLAGPRGSVRLRLYPGVEKLAGQPPGHTDLRSGRQ